jgi:diguanylate cyclase (GGDEF)-like protein/PAS domain S-box-containing protein
MTVLDLHGRFLYVNEALCRLLGYDRSDLMSHHRTDFIHPDDLKDATLFGEVLADPTGVAFREFRCVRSDGQVIWLLLSASVIRDDDGQPLCVATYAQNITDRRETAFRWQRTFDHAPIGMALLDTRGRWTEVNTTFCELLGYPREELLATQPTHLTYPGDEGSSVLAEVVEGRKDTASWESCFRHKLGYPVWLFARVSAVPGPDDRPSYLVGQYEEIGDGRMRDEHLAHLALHDPLTGLANRVLLADRLDHGLADLPRAGGVLAVLLADMDRLKHINDYHGHTAGDQLLRSAGDALLRVAHPDDTVARLGGDEFVVLSRLADFHAAQQFRDRVEQSLQAETVISGNRLTMRASVGLAATADPTTSRAELLHTADRDMYDRKRRTRN